MANLDIVARVIDKTRQGTASAQKNVGGLRKRLGGLAASAGSLPGPLGQASSALGLGPAGLATAAGGAALAIGTKLIGDLVATSKELDNLSNRSGVGVESLQVLSKIAESSGGNAEDVADAFREMNLRLAEASSLGSGPAVDALNLLQIPLEQIQELSPEDQFALIRDRLSEIPDVAQRTFLAEELLGGSSERLAELVGLSTEEFNKQSQSISESGRVISGEGVASAVAFGAATTELTDSVSGLVMNLVAGLLPPLLTVTDFLKNSGPLGTGLIIITGLLGGAAVSVGVLGAVIGPLTAGWAALSGAINISNISTAASNVVTGIRTGITIASTVATVAATAATTAFGVALNIALGPIGLVILAITGIIAIVALLIANWDLVSAKTTEIWEGIKSFFNTIWQTLVGLFQDNWDKILAILFPTIGIPILIARNWGAIVETVRGIANGVIGWFEGMANGAIGAINSIIGAWNNFEIRLGGQQVNLPFGQSFTIPNISVGTPNAPFIPRVSIPRLQSGGIVTSPTIAEIGEAGPEAVIPLNRLDQIGSRITIIQNIQGSIIQERSAERVAIKGIQRNRRRSGVGI